MKRAQITNDCCERRGEGGQVVVIVLFVLGFFLLAVSAFGVDMANFWFHRQAAQGAADAACTAGVMDMLVNATTGSSLGGFPGGDFNCSASPTAVPCQYAALNGYNGTGLTPGNTVQVRFVATSSIAGIDPNAIPGIAPNALEIEITERVQTFFSGLLTGNRTQTVRVRSRCAVLKAQAPVPLLVLNPTCPSTLSRIGGSNNVSIIGGPNQSIQINSSSATAVSGNGTINLSMGGPTFSGSIMGVFGGPATPPGTFTAGGTWSYPSSPIGDPFAAVPAPTLPLALSPTNTTPISVPAYPDPNYGCPDHDHTKCDVYLPGQYTNPIVVKNRTAVFVPGLYYFNIAAGNFDNANCGTPGGCIANPTGQCHYSVTVDSNGIVRMAKGALAAGDGSRGLTFYFSGGGGPNGYGSIFYGSNAGSAGGRTVDPYDTTDATTGVSCPGATVNPALGLPATVTGNVTLGPCTQDGTYFASPSNASMIGPTRGMVFFQDRRNGDNHGQPSMQGGGQMIISGNMYFHHCPTLNPPLTGTTSPCNPATEYKAFFQIQGNPGSGTYLLGNITADEVILGGSASLFMQLDTRAVYTILRATLVQ